MAPEPPAFVRLAAHPLRWSLLTALAGGDLRVRELAEHVGQPQNLVSYHLRLLRDGGLVVVTRSSSDGRDSYYHLDLDRCSAALTATGAALHPGLLREPAPARPGITVLFVCTGNSARSPIAAALLRQRTGGRVAATSAGSHPKAALHPEAVRVLAEEFGIDVAGQRPRHLDAVAGDRFDHVITVCDKVREVCPAFPHRRHWSIPDPAAAADPGAFRRTAAELDTRVRHLLPELGAAQDKEVQS
ncbi:protein-tyrosine-phosphatase/DNA-binding transcriptional ArsR family regulator [Amycolatopsis lexingtonensis]|uniref:Protein-tyrosine-phosphatase/DNA-binding transcriptional ArsR family regulator n=1 Tax=Amycolatopsis lexingtonensis TaxID=218822 RepID=A0ABR9HR72_9PSEU|nr:ArsR family transcriptional regulator [Amycolatopsis lexingtonensis]MBE1493419.1 protein-tyrosine-phosphatase/DNA-binding transcriptional ArsR family regulator [Amycolatopsis lexingtonensis]